MRWYSSCACSKSMRACSSSCARTPFRAWSASVGRCRLADGGFVCIAVVGTVELGQHLALLDALSLFDEHARHAAAHLEGRLSRHVGFNRTACGG